MDKTTIIEKLDRLAEYNAQRDAIELQKRALLEEVKTPDDVIDVQRQNNEAARLHQEAVERQIEALKYETDKELSTVQIPPEVRQILDKIDHERAEIMRKHTEKVGEMIAGMTAYRTKLQSETESKTRQVFNDLAARKQEIEYEFSGAARAVDENIRKLKSEIEADTLKHGDSVKGKFLLAVWSKGRSGTWITDNLEKVPMKMPGVVMNAVLSIVQLDDDTVSKLKIHIAGIIATTLSECRNPDGKPSVTFRNVK